MADISALVQFAIFSQWVGAWPLSICFVLNLRVMFSCTHQEWKLVDSPEASVFRSESDFRGHYTGTWSTRSAQTSGHPLWSSEDYSNKNDDDGGGCLARVRSLCTAEKGKDRQSARHQMFTQHFLVVSDFEPKLHQWVYDQVDHLFTSN